jgi:hypothetical protein
MAGCRSIFMWHYVQDGPITDRADSLITDEADPWRAAIPALIFQRFQESPLLSPIVPKQCCFRFHDADRLKVLRRQIGALYPIWQLHLVRHMSSGSRR